MGQAATLAEIELGLTKPTSSDGSSGESSIEKLTRFHPEWNRTLKQIIGYYEDVTTR